MENNLTMRVLFYSTQTKQNYIIISGLSATHLIIKSGSFNFCSFSMFATGNFDRSKIIVVSSIVFPISAAISSMLSHSDLFFSFLKFS